MRLIDSDWLLDKLSSDDPANMEDYYYNAIKEAPTIEAEPVRHGYWDASGKYTFPDGSLAVRCSECGCDLEEHEYKEYWWHYCPVCGAKMDGKEPDDR